VCILPMVTGLMPYSRSQSSAEGLYRMSGIGEMSLSLIYVCVFVFSAVIK